MGETAQMSRIIDCWAMAETRAKHLCAFETLGLNARCRKPTQQEVRKAWHRLCMRFHPDKHLSANDLATEATRCINLAKQHLFEDYYGGAESRVAHKHRSKDDVIVVDEPISSGNRSSTQGLDPTVAEEENDKRQRGAHSEQIPDEQSDAQPPD